MTERTQAKVIDGELAREVSFEDFAADNRVSPTAASVSNRLYGPSGPMDYTVVLANGGARQGTVVHAKDGDEAAEKALARHPGWKVAYVGPRGDETRDVDALAGE